MNNSFPVSNTSCFEAVSNEKACRRTYVDTIHPLILQRQVATKPTSSLCFHPSFPRLHLAISNLGAFLTTPLLLKPHAWRSPARDCVFCSWNFFTNSTSYSWIHASSCVKSFAENLTSQPPHPVPWCKSRTPKVNFEEPEDHPAGPLQKKKWGLTFQCPPIVTQTVHLNWLLDMTRTGLL